MISFRMQIIVWAGPIDLPSDDVGDARKGTGLEVYAVNSSPLSGIIYTPES